MNVIEYKSNVFALLMEEKDYAAEVYNVLNGSSYTADMLEIKKHNSGVILSVRNDASFLVDSYLNLYEHQSTYCHNMPLRFMIYFAAIMKKIMLPTPKFVVFYNGLQNRPEKEIMRLSDAFEKKEDTYQLELECEVYNINPGSNESVVNSSSVLYGYRTFVEITRAYIEEDIEIEKAVSMSVDECIGHGILSDFFVNRRREIEKVAALDFTFERREKLIARDNYEDGRSAGISEGRAVKEIELAIKMVQKGMNVEEISDLTGEPVDKMSKVCEIIKKNVPDYDIEKILEELN